MNKELRFMILVKRITTFGLMVGVVLFLFSLFVSGVKADYILSISLAIIASSMMTFGFSLFLSLMEKLTETPSKDTQETSIHYYEPNIMK